MTKIAGMHNFPFELVPVCAFTMTLAFAGPLPKLGLGYSRRSSLPRPMLHPQRRSQNRRQGGQDVGITLR